MILVCGEALIDFFPSGRGPLSFDGAVGGSPFNVAIGLARLGAQASFYSGLSRDLFGVRLAQTLAEEGVDLAHAIRTERPTTLSFVALDDAGVPTYLFLGEGAADRSVDPASLPDLGDTVAAIHLGSFSAVVEPVGSTLVALVAREGGRRVVSYDPNIRPTVCGDLGLWRARIDELVPHVSLLKISAEDLELVHPGLGAAAAAERWLAAGVSLVVVTKGGEGAEAFTPRFRASVPGVPVAVIDTVGAGDTFQAALLAGLDRKGVLSRPGLAAIGGDALADILAEAAVAAAITCSRRGADLPRRAEVERFLAERRP
jgi:fructokinase